jgi:hypothetical protein
MIVPIGGYFQVGRDNDFPWWSTDRMTWYFTVDTNGDMKGYTPSKTNKKFLTTYLAENPSISLFGVWTGKYSTSIFAFDSKVAIEKLKGES